MTPAYSQNPKTLKTIRPLALLPRFPVGTFFSKIDDIFRYTIQQSLLSYDTHRIMSVLSNDSYDIPIGKLISITNTILREFSSAPRGYENTLEYKLAMLELEYGLPIPMKQVPPMDSGFPQLPDAEETKEPDTDDDLSDCECDCWECTGMPPIPEVGPTLTA